MFSCITSMTSSTCDCTLIHEKQERVVEKGQRQFSKCSCTPTEPSQDLTGVSTLKSDQERMCSLTGDIQQRCMGQAVLIYTCTDELDLRWWKYRTIPAVTDVCSVEWIAIKANCAGVSGHWAYHLLQTCPSPPTTHSCTTRSDGLGHQNTSQAKTSGQLWKPHLGLLKQFGCVGWTTPEARGLVELNGGVQTQNKSSYQYHIPNVNISG